MGKVLLRGENQPEVNTALALPSTARLERSRLLCPGTKFKNTCMVTKIAYDKVKLFLKTSTNGVRHPEEVSKYAKKQEPLSHKEEKFSQLKPNQK